jgi:hypothetical protein
MRNITETVRQRDHDRVKPGARKTHLVSSLDEVLRAVRGLQQGDQFDHQCRTEPGNSA